MQGNKELLSAYIGPISINATGVLVAERQFKSAIGVIGVVLV